MKTRTLRQIVSNSEVLSQANAARNRLRVIRKRERQSRKAGQQHER